MIGPGVGPSFYSGVPLPFPGATFGSDFTASQYQLNGAVYSAPTSLPGWTFTRASTGYAETAAGVLVPFASGAPRITDKGLLIEEARTNLLPRSQEFNNASWSQASVTVTPNAVIAPDGTLTADKLIASAAAASHNIFQAPTLTDSTDYTGSVFAKAGEWTWLQIIMRSKDSATETGAYFNLSAGTVGTTDAGITATITALADGWYRCTAKKNAGAGATAPRFRAVATNADAAATPLGDGTSGIYIWGAQLEAGAFPTSYIPTTTASATRAADVATLTGLSLAFPCAILLEAMQPALNAGASSVFLCADDGTTNERVWVYNDTSAVRCIVVDGGVAQVNTNTANNSAGVVFKTASRLATNDVATVLNGGTVSADVVATMPSTDRLTIGVRSAGTNAANAYIRRAILYPTAFTDAQLQAATA